MCAQKTARAFPFNLPSVCPEPVLANHLVCRKAHETRCGFLNAGIVSSQASDDGTDVIVRFVNPRTVPVTLDLTVKGKGKGGRHGRGCVLTSASAGVSANLTVLHSDNLWDANTPSEPTAVSPVTTAVSDLGKIEVPANSFVIVAVAGVGCALE